MSVQFYQMAFLDESIRACVSFLGKLQERTTNSMASNNRSQLPHSSGGQKFKIKMSAGPRSFPNLLGSPPQPLPGFWGFSGCLCHSLQLPHSCLRIRCQMVFSLYVPVLTCQSYKHMSHIGLQTHTLPEQCHLNTIFESALCPNKVTYIMRYWVSGLQHIFFGEHNSTHNAYFVHYKHPPVI